MKLLPEVHNFVVQTLVALGGVGPAEVALHGAVDQHGPTVLLPVAFLGTPAGLIQLVGVVVGKGEAVAEAVAGIVDGVTQAAGLADNGDGTVAAGDHLGQTAGLGAGRHQEDVGTGVDLLGQFGVEADVNAHAARIAGAQLVEEVLVLAFAGAEDDQLDALLQQAFGDSLDEVNAFVADQTGDHGHDGAAVLMQAELVLQGSFAGGLAILEGVGIIVLDDVGVGGGVKDIHVDAVQVAGKLPIHPEELGADFLSISAHKFHGPKGVGLLYHNDLHFDNLLYGGEQEEKRRASTENLVGIAGMTAAYKHASDHYQDNYQHVEKIRQAFLDSLTIPYEINGGGPSLPHVINISFPDKENGPLLTLLDLAGFAVSTGSACTAGTVDPSHVIQALYGKDSDKLKTAIRISLSEENTAEELQALAEKLNQIIGD